jgi:hypothetical protein
VAPRSVHFGVKSWKLSNVGQSLDGCMTLCSLTKNVLSRVPPCFGRQVKPLVPAAFAVPPTRTDPA